MYYNQRIPIKDLRELKFRAYEIFGTDRLDDIWDVVDVSLSRIENDPIQKSLLIILESYDNENSGISLNNRFIPINELKEKLICNKKEAELFRQEFYSLIEKILLDNQEILLKKLRENFPEVIKKGKKKKIDNVS